MVKKQITLILVSLVITTIFIVISIPKFISNEQVISLLEKVNSVYPSEELEEIKNPNNSSESQKPNINNNDKNQNENKVDVPQNNNSNSSHNNSGNSHVSNPSSVMKTFSIKFDSNGASSISDSIKSCSTTSSSCEITLPSIFSDKAVVGWSNDANATNSIYKANETISVSSDLTLYAITQKSYTVLINGNGAFKGTQSIGCTIYNKQTSCNVVLPSIPKDYYTVVGYNQDGNSDAIVYSEGQSLSLMQNLTLYVVRKIDTTEYDSYANVAKYVFQKTNDLRKSKGLKELNWSKSLELSAMLRISELKKNYDFNVNGDYHYRISNSQPFWTVNELSMRENYYSVYRFLDADALYNAFLTSKEGHYENMVAGNITICGFAVGFDGEWYYIVELFG